MTNYLIVNDILTQMSYHLIEPTVNTMTTSVQPAGYSDGGYSDGGYSDGIGTVVGLASSDALYVGAMVIVGLGLPDEEVGTVLEINSDGTVTMALENTHSPGETVVGATFPVGETPDPFWSQSEMLSYVSEAQNDYLVRVPLIYNVIDQTFAPQQRLMSSASDTIQIERIAYNNVSLYEQGQTSYDCLNYNWQQEALGNPQSWYEDRTGLLTYGVRPIPGNMFSVEVLYAQRGPATLALNSQFLLPDPFCYILKYGALAACFSKDGEQRDPERARYCQQRFDNGVRIGQQLMINLQAQEVVNGQ